MRTHRSKSTTDRPHRSGFTLLELLAVITIISILLALILPVISGVIGRGDEVAVSTEMTQLDQALTTFKSKFGIYPPSNLIIPEIPPSGPPIWAPADRAAIKEIWPQFNFATNGSLGNSTALHLNGAECLVFFLGGVQTGTTSAPVLVGFSKNPLTPWTQSGNPDGPFMEFDLSRMSDVDGDGVFEYLDAMPGQTTPLLYLSKGSGSMNKDNDNMLRTLPPHSETRVPVADDYDVFGDSNDMDSCYLQTDADADFTNNLPYKKDSFQLISPGEDGLYGPGGVYIEGEQLTGNRKPEADNITNFSGGTLD